ncbi:hypothetical protein ACFHW2_43550 [Actinomadura sp. LOL_016]|uniref:hypothetical protein n=1 Tax=unclassified Actinomadura TaxID=2626254 RepID=UPI003A8017D5
MFLHACHALRSPIALLGHAVLGAALINSAGLAVQPRAAASPGPPTMLTAQAGAAVTITNGVQFTDSSGRALHAHSGSVIKVRDH